MINLELYDREFEEQYYRKVKAKVSEKNQESIENIIESSEKFLPNDFYSALPEDRFRELILAPYSKLKRAKEYIKKNSLYIMKNECFEINDAGKMVKKTLYKQLALDFESIMKLQMNKENIRVKIAKNNGKLTVCPYCNRDYINNRGSKKSGAQIDHFYPHAKYPVFTLCLYNLVPACGNCNRLKSNSDVEYASPWDESINWDSDVQFSYLPKSIDEYQIVINAQGKAGNNIEGMEISEAYSIHSVEIKDLLEKQKFYAASQNEEIRDIMKELAISEQDIKRAVFGEEITSEMIKNKSLGRMTRDLQRKLKIF